MKNILTRLKMEEKGQAFILALILLAVGGLIIVPLLGFMGTGLMAARLIEQKVDETYAADAGIEDAIWKILNNDASLPNTLGASSIYTIADINGKDVEVNIKLEEDIENFLEGLLGDDAGPHDEWTTISQNVGAGTYTITVTYSGAAQNKRINGAGAWLEGDYTYVVGSVVGMTDDYPIFDFRTESYKGGTAFIWEWGPSNPPKPAFGLQTGVYERSLTFEFTIAEVPPFHFSWLVGSSSDIGVVASAVTFGIWKVTATVGQTQVVAYVSSNGEEVPYRAKVLTWEINP